MTTMEAKHFSEVLKAYAEGKIIQFKNNDGNWVDGTVYNFSEDPSKYRIKPEPKFRPYENAEEFLNAQKKHGLYLIKKDGYNTLFPIKINDFGVSVYYHDQDSCLTMFCYNDLLNYWSHQDGTLCGVMED